MVSKRGLSGQGVSESDEHYLEKQAGLVVEDKTNT